MPGRSARIDRLSRKAALKVSLCAAFVLGFCLLLLRVTVWTPGEAAEAEPVYTTLPGVDMGGLTAARQQEIVKRLNVQRCPCDCSRTVASCRLHHSSCSLSLADGRAAVAAARRH
jgi:hypothetical protein